ncbi:hypothetical protein ACOJQI_10720 [Bacillus salacetis]|uniref:hypothetical protein n=1 Tax=Bacillus salacetis TaxID=2315464 RepID=UPI003B9EBF9E
MKKPLFISLIFILLLLTGCRVEMSMPPDEQEAVAFDGVADAQEIMRGIEEVSEKPLNEDGEINTKIDIVGEFRGSRSLKLIGESNLPEGAVLTVIFQEFIDDPALTETDILEGAEPTGAKVFQEDVIVKSGGEFSTSFVHRDKMLFGKLTVTFHPEKQPVDLQQVYGPHGENILNEEKGNGKIKYEVDGVEHTGYQVYTASGFMSTFNNLYEDYNAFMSPY